MTSPDTAPGNIIFHRLGRVLAYSALSLTLSASSCEPVTTTTDPSPAVVALPAGAIFLDKPNGTSCGTLAEAKLATRSKLAEVHDTHGTVSQIFGGYATQELGICLQNAGGIAWHDEGQVILPPAPYH